MIAVLRRHIHRDDITALLAATLGTAAITGRIQWLKKHRP